MSNPIVFDERDFFDETGISEAEAWAACERFVAFRQGESTAFQLYQGQDAQRLISRDEILHYLQQRLEDGAQILVA